MEIYAGSSGFSYKQWKGPFYPADLKNDAMLAYYASKLDTVEINNTFYRMPKQAVLEKWAEQVGDNFRFVLKASRRITHQARLKDADDSVAYLWKNAQALGEKLGPLLFQLPPYLRKDTERLKAFLGGLPKGAEVAMEFRHASWFEAEVIEVLRDHGAALCFTDTDTDPTDDADSKGVQPLLPPLEATATFGYLRLRRAEYTPDDLDGWRTRLAERGWQRAFVFFKHEDDGAAPRLAMALRGDAQGTATGNDAP